MSNEVVEILYRIRNARQAQTDTEKLGGSVEKLGKKVDKTGRDMERANKRGGGLTGTFKKMRGPLAGIAGGFASLGVVNKLTESVDKTEALAKSTLMLSTNFGLTTETASAWSAVAASRDMDPTALHMGFTKLGKAAVDAMRGGEKSKWAFQRLGLTQKDLLRGTHDFQFLLGKVGKGFTDYKGGAWRAKDATALFGRGAKSLVPLLKAGKGGLEDQLKMAEKYGATFKGKTINDMKDFIAAQRESQIASMGLSVTLGTTLIPMLTWIRRATARVLGVFQTLPGGVQAGVLAFIAVAGGAMMVLSMLTLLGPGFAIASGGMAAFMGSTMLLRAQLALLAIGQGIVTAAQWLWNGALIVGAAAMTVLTSPITLIILGLAAIAAGFYFVYTKITWFRNGVDAVVGFVKKHWKLMLAILVGPIGLAAYFIIKHFRSILGFVRGMPGRISKFASGMWDGLKNAFRSALNWIISKWNNFEIGFGPVKIPGPVPDIPRMSIGTPNIPLLAHGGLVRGIGRWITGDAGPELNEFQGDGSVRVTPLAGGVAAAGMGGGDVIFDAPLYLHPGSIQELARVVGRGVSDRKARTTGDA